MKTTLQLRCVLVALVLVFSISLSKAQLGSGWGSPIRSTAFEYHWDHLDVNNGGTNTEDWATYRSFRGCQYWFSGSLSDYTSGTHKFKLASDPDCERSEIKFEYSYSSSERYQFQGDLKLTSGTPGPKHIMQIWQNMSNENKILVLDCQPAANDFSKSTIRVPSNSLRDFSVNRPYTFSHGTWVKVNVIHVRSDRMVYIYINGELRFKYKHGSVSGSYYFKFGAYSKEEMSKAAQSEWRSVKYFKGGYPKSQVVDETAQSASALSAEISPNPVKGVAKVTYCLQNQSKVQISVCDVTGKRVATLVNQVKDAGSYTEEWDASALPKGVYFVNMMTNDVSKTEKIIVE